MTQARNWSLLLWKTAQLEIFEISSSQFWHPAPTRASSKFQPSKHNFVHLLEIVGHCCKFGLKLDQNAGSMACLLLPLTLSLSPDTIREFDDVLEWLQYLAIVCNCPICLLRCAMSCLITLVSFWTATRLSSKMVIFFVIKVNFSSLVYVEVMSLPILL